MRLALFLAMCTAPVALAAECPLLSQAPVKIETGTCEKRATSSGKYVPTQCAEEDNVRVMLWDDHVTDFRVTSSHAEVIQDWGRKYEDNAPNFANCPSNPSALVVRRPVV